MSQVPPQVPPNTLGDNTIGDNDNDNNNDIDMKSNDNNNNTNNALKNDVILSLRGTPEYDEFPYSSSKEKFLFMASIKAPLFKRTADRAAIDLVCVIDESSSMSGDRIKLVKETIEFVIKNLQKNDRFGCIGYSTTSRNILSLTKMDQNGKLLALDKCRAIRATGCTALCAGLVDGVNMLRKRNKKNMNSIASVMLFTDGQANEGPRDAAGIIKAIETGKIQSNSGNRFVQQQPYYGGYGQQQYVPQQLQQQQQQQQMPQFQQMPQQLNQMQGIPSNQLPQQQMQQNPYAQGLNMNNINNNINSNITGTNNFQPGSASILKKLKKKKNTLTPTPKPNASNDNDDDNKNDDVLPCTINTFGFGSDHNSSLLEAIAERGRGMYAFIKNKDEIGETFAEALGGLVSIIGQNLKITIEALNGVSINKCLSKGFNTKIITPNKIQQILIPDIQSEESRDMLFEININSLNCVTVKQPIIKFNVEYMNTIKDKNEILEIISTLDRSDNNDIGERNMELDLQYNRLIAANAMKQANDYAQTGKLNDARNYIKNAQNIINKSRTNKNTYCVNLVADLQKCSQGLKDVNAYKNVGNQMLVTNSMAHYQQRSAQSNQYAAQKMYTNSSKHAWVQQHQQQQQSSKKKW